MNPFALSVQRDNPHAYEQRKQRFKRKPFGPDAGLVALVLG